LAVTLGEIAFADADGAEITDLTTEVAAGQKIVGLSKGHSMVADGTAFAIYTIAINEIEEMKTPTLASKDDRVTVDAEGLKVQANYYIDEPMNYEDLAKTFEVAYGEVVFTDANDKALADLKAELAPGSKIQLLAKDCPGVPDGTLVATYVLGAEKLVKEVKFESKDDTKISIDADEKIVTVLKGMTVGEFLENMDIQFAEVEIYGVDSEDPITDAKTVIVEGMSIVLVTDAVIIPYDFAVADAVEGEGDADTDNTTDKEDKPADTGVVVPVVAFALLGAAVAGVVSTKKRRH